MDNKKFAQDAFAQAQRATIEWEADAFQDFMRNHFMDMMQKALVFAGPDEMATLIETVQRMGLEDVMHRYEKAIIVSAFHEGCQAGRMMEDTK